MFRYTIGVYLKTKVKTSVVLLYRSHALTSPFRRSFKIRSSYFRSGQPIRKNVKFCTMQTFSAIVIYTLSGAYRFESRFGGMWNGGME